MDAATAGLINKLIAVIDKLVHYGNWPPHFLLPCVGDPAVAADSRPNQLGQVWGAIAQVKKMVASLAQTIAGHISTPQLLEQSSAKNPQADLGATMQETIVKEK